MKGRIRPDFFFSPGSVAVVGASPVKGKISNVILESLKDSGFKGAVYPVNPRHDRINGLECVPSLNDIRGGVDIAVFAVPASSTPGLIREAKGKLRGAVIISGGFAEAGGAGEALERELKELAGPVRIIGPNCMGIYDTVSKVDTFFIPAERIKRPGPGGLSIISQSGSFAVTAMDELAAEGIGVARVISYGNKADVNEADCLDMLERDAHTTAVAVYIESIDDGRRFVKSASAVSAKKPVMAIKVGKTEASAVAARLHTGAMAGRYEFYKAAFKKAGVIELNGYEDFLSACKAFGAGLAHARGNRVMIITDGGGMGVAIADECAKAGLTAPPLDAMLEKSLRRIFPPYFAAGNPIDLTGSATDETFASSLEMTMSGDGYDMAIVAALWGPPALTDKLPEMLAKKAAVFKKPVLICSPGGEYTRARVKLFSRHGLPVFPAPEGAVRAAGMLAKYARRTR